MIRISGLVHNTGKQNILQDLSLDIPKGKITALVGPNGAGKSTLLSLIARLTPLQKGEILIDTLQLGQCRSDVLAQKLAILSQSIHMESRLSVRELVSFGRYPHSKGRLKADDWHKVDDALALLDLEELQDRSLDTLSGGQRQRAFVAMTYVQDTDYILLDEPLNNMDIAASRSLMKLLQKLCNEHKKTIVIVLHDINYASGYADNIVALSDGRILHSGPPTQVICSDFLQDIYGTSATVHMLDNRPFVQV